MNLAPAQYYFLADVHLGAKLPGEQGVTTLFLDFLNSIPKETKAIYLLGDTFDFWGEFRGEHPKDYEEVLVALKKLTSNGLRIVFLKGNHDYWTFGYLAKEIGLEIVDKQPYIATIEGKRFCLAHGDGLGRCGLGYRIVKFVFRNKLCIKLLNLFPAESVFNFGRGWSKSRKQKHQKAEQYHYKKEQYRLSSYSEKYLKKDKVDYFFYGHIHNVVISNLSAGTRMMVLGDWYHLPSYISYSEGQEPNLNFIN